MLKQPLRTDEYARYSKLVSKMASEVAAEASKDGPARQSFKKSRVGIPTVSEHFHLAPCLELGDGDGDDVFLADVVFAFSTIEARNTARGARRKAASAPSPTERPPVYLFVHWHEDAHVVGGPLALPCQVTYLGNDYSIIRADSSELRLLRAVKVVPQLDDFGGMVLPTRPCPPQAEPSSRGGYAAGGRRGGRGRQRGGHQAASASAPGRAGAAVVASTQPQVEIRRPRPGGWPGLSTVSITRRYAMCYKAVLYVG